MVYKALKIEILICILGFAFGRRVRLKSWTHYMEHLESRQRRNLITSKCHVYIIALFISKTMAVITVVETLEFNDEKI